MPKLSEMTVETRILEVMTFGARRVITEREVGGDWDFRVEREGQNMVLMMQARMLATEPVVVEDSVYVPVNWYEHLLHDLKEWLPKQTRWWLPRWVKRAVLRRLRTPRRKQLTLTVEGRRLFPDIPIPPGRHAYHYQPRPVSLKLYEP